MPVASPFDSVCAAFLGVEQSCTGRRWLARPYDERAALAMAQRHGLPDILARSLSARGVALDARHLAVQGFNILLGSVVPYGLWNSALRHWQTSRVMLFNNLIPLSTAVWAHFCLREPISSAFWLAMMLIVAGVMLGQWDWSKYFKPIKVG